MASSIPKDQKSLRLDFLNSLSNEDKAKIHFSIPVPAAGEITPEELEYIRKNLSPEGWNLIFSIINHVHF